jgi:NitT/TauT family transport system permease protein
LATIHVVVLGLLLGSAAGIVIGLATGLSRVLAACLEPILTILFALPKIALVPLFILWFGLDSTERVVFTASVVFFLVYLAVFTGVRRIPVSLDNSLRLIGATLPQRLVALYIPGSIGWLIAGLRIAVPYAFLSAVGAEVVGAQEGLGYLIKTSAYSVDPNGMMAAILVLVVLAVGAMAAAEALDRVSRWRL